MASLEILVNWHPILTGQNPFGWPAKAKLSLAIAEQVNSGEVWIQGLTGRINFSSVKKHVREDGMLGDHAAESE